MTPEATDSPTTRTLRRALLALAGLGAVFTPIELVLMKHYRSPAQLIPYGLVALALVALGLIWRANGPRAVRTAQVLLTLVLLGSGVGVLEHLSANAEIVREDTPTATGLTLLWASVQGHAPLLASGILAQVALLGLAATYRHPGWSQRPTHLQPKVRPGGPASGPR